MQKNLSSALVAFFEPFAYSCYMNSEQATNTTLMSPDFAIGMTVNQYLFINGMSASSLGPILGVSRSSVTRKLRGLVGWSVTELLTLSTYFGVDVQNFMPAPDGMGGWIPAPYKPGYTKTPALDGAGVGVPQVGLEPTTHGL